MINKFALYVKFDDWQNNEEKFANLKLLEEPACKCFIDKNRKLTTNVLKNVLSKYYIILYVLRLKSDRRSSYNFSIIYIFA